MIGAILRRYCRLTLRVRSGPTERLWAFHPDCAYTDDTVCTMLLPMRCWTNVTIRRVCSMCRRYPDPMGGYRQSIYQWINADNPVPMNSFGNGSAMRVSPIGWLFDEWEDVVEEAKKSAMVTHNHPEGHQGCTMYCWNHLLATTDAFL